MRGYWAYFFVVGVACAVLAGFFHEPWLEVVAGVWMADGVVWLAVDLARTRR